MDYTIALSYILCVENNTLAYPIGENYTKAQPHIISYCTKAQPERLTHHHNRQKIK